MHRTIRSGSYDIHANVVEGRQPTVIFCGGFMSDMAGTKAMALDTWCRERGQGFARFDYSGHGESGGKFEDGTIGQWLGDTLSVIDGLTEGPVILVGSSMGGWVMLLAALARPVRVTGLVGIASAPDFTDELLWGEMSPEEQAELMDSGRIEQPSDYDDEPYIITRRLVEEGRRHLLLGDTIHIHCPVRLLHSLDDPDVPWETSLRIMRQLSHDDVRLILLKDAGHRVSRPEDLALVMDSLEGLLGSAGTR